MNILLAAGKQIKAIIKHKYYTYVIGREFGIDKIKLLAHDISKLSPITFFAYTMSYYSLEHSRFLKARSDHITRYSHHLDYHKDRIIPFEFVLDIILDWIAAEKAYNSSKWSCETPYSYFKTIDGISMHPVTYKLIETILYDLKTKGFEYICNKIKSEEYSKVYNDLIYEKSMRSILTN